jgi:hypothetical protein
MDADIRGYMDSAENPANLKARADVIQTEIDKLHKHTDLSEVEQRLVLSKEETLKKQAQGLLDHLRLAGVSRGHAHAQRGPWVVNNDLDLRSLSLARKAYRRSAAFGRDKRGVDKAWSMEI